MSWPIRGKNCSPFSQLSWSGGCGRPVFAGDPCWSEHLRVNVFEVALWVAEHHGRLWTLKQTHGEISMYTHDKVSLSLQLRQHTGAVWPLVNCGRQQSASRCNFESITVFAAAWTGAKRRLMEATPCFNQPARANPRTTWRRLRSPLSLAGLPSEPLLLPDCSFSFKSAVAYAKVSCRVWYEHKDRHKHRAEGREKKNKTSSGFMWQTLQTSVNVCVPVQRWYAGRFYW